MTRSAPWPRSPDPVPGLPAPGSAPARTASPLLQSLTQLAGTLCDAPVALLSLIEPQHHAVCASVGLALGGSTVLPHLTWSVQTLPHVGLLQVPDTQTDPRFASDRLAWGEAPLRFYAGVALRQDDGPPFGTLCVMDHRPRTLTPEVARQLEALADSCAQALALTRRAQDAALAETEGRYRAIVESQGELISLSTPDGTLTFVNTAYARHFDRPAAELLGTHILELIPPNDQEAVASHLASVCSHRLVLSNETRYVDADGQVSWISWTNSPVLDRQGQVTAIQSVGRDVTERKLTERSLKESQARLRSLYESTPAMLHSIDAQGRLLSVSDTWLAKMGYTRREVIGRNSAEFLTAASLDYARKVVLPRYLQEGRCENIEYQMVRKDGSLIDVLLSATMERDEHGQPLRSLAVLEDVTEKHAVEAALRSNQEILTLATQTNGIGIWEYNLIEQRLAWSDIMFQIFGMSREAFHGRLDDWRNCVHPEDQAMCDDQITETLATGQPMNFDFRVVHPDGAVRDVNARATVFYDEQGQAVRLLGTNYDATEHRRMARELAEKHELLRVTLNSIGDAVITTDAQGQVLWLNPVAERMTGWPAPTAQGRPLAEVFQIINETTREPEPCPVTRCLAGALDVGDTSQTLLIAQGGREYGIEDSAAPIRDEQGQVLGAVLIFRDVTEQRRMDREMNFRATHDQLTGLVNRAEFESRLQRALDDAHQRDSSHALMYIDLDQFKLVNDACGHAVGDQLLCQVTDLLLASVRSRDTLARLGGDEFGMILEHCTADQALRVAQKICDQMEEFRFVHDGRRFRIGTSIGLVPLDKRWASTSAVLQAADTSCYAAKEAGRNRVHAWFDTDQTMRARKGEMQWATRLEQALDEDRFVLYGQRIEPIHQRDSGLHCEVLLRLREPDGSIIPPGAFLPAAERFHLASRIDRWVVRAVFDLLTSGDPALAYVHTLSVNLSGQSLGDPSFQRQLVELIDRSGADVSKLCFEITETAAITKLAEASQFMQDIRQLGVRLALDDFGAGSSSFGYLKALPVDYLKIDGQFVRDLVHDPLDRAAVRCFCDVARVLGLQTVGEFVESEAILEELRVLGVDFAQGYLIHQPEPLAHLLGLDTAAHAHLAG